jgi:AcrR family transcriptional regulator
MRKNAKQARAKQTVEAILEATTQLLEAADLDQVSTNHVAERAGVSIGTLYQYFPNKTAIFLAIAERDIEHRFQLVAAAITEAQDEFGGATIRTMISALIASFAESGRNEALVRVLITTRGSAKGRTLPVDIIAQLLAEAAQGQDQIRPLTETSAFVLTRAVLWTILTATLDAPHLLKQQAFEDELVLLVSSFLSIHS